MAQIITDSVTITFSRLVKDDNKATSIISDDELVELTSFIEMLNDGVTDGRVIEMELSE